MTKTPVIHELKKAMGGDAYKELLQNNIGKIVRDSAKGVSIDSIWGEMTSLFPEHFSADMTTQVDQITHLPQNRQVPNGRKTIHPCRITLRESQNFVPHYLLGL